MTRDVTQRILGVIRSFTKDTFTENQSRELTNRIVEIVDAAVAEALIEAMSFGEILKSVGLEILGKKDEI